MVEQEEMLKPSSDTSSTPSATGKQEEKTDIKKLLAVIPPPAVVFAKEKKSLKEKRIRLQYDPSVGKDEAKISKTLASELNIKNYLEVTVAGKKRFRFKAVVLEGPPNDVVYVNPEVMKLQGVADRSICTIRSAD